MAQLSEPANRQFYSLPLKKIGVRPTNQDTEPHEGQAELTTDDFPNSTKDRKKSLLLEYISANVIGADKTFSGPFGLRKVTYLDFIASGRALHFIEDYICSEVLPEYGNTHTTTSVTSLQTTLFRHEARDILRNSFNASEHDSVIFTGSGSTGAVHKLIHALNLKENSAIVLVGPFEHHSNILPWKEAGAEVIRICQTEEGHLNMNHLEGTLKAHQGDSRQLIGAFSAASNVTGVLTDVNAVTICLHKHGALAVWDYACAAPYVKLDMNPYVGGPDQQYVYKDAVVLSVHKFVGGVSTPGVLMAKKKLFRHPVPEGCGGGTIFFVRRDNHRYLQEPESKEEGGTPAIVQSIRAGLVVQLKQAVGVDTIYSRDQWLLSHAQAAWKDCPELIQLGPPPGPGSPEKLPIFSFLVLHPQTGRFLHHNFVTAVLNDVFGIQARGGCACAGPYAMDLLGLDEKEAKRIEELIAEDSRLDRTHLRRIGEYSHREILRPGFVRLNLPYFMDEDCLHFVLEAIKLTAEHSWMLLPQYLFNPETAEWRQRHFQTFKDRKWLGHISYQSCEMKYHHPKQVVKGPLPTSYQDCLHKAREIFENAKKLRLKIPDQTALFDEEARPYRWFVLPSEASACLLLQQGSSSTPRPLCVRQSELPFFPGRPIQTEAKAHDPTGRMQTNSLKAEDIHSTDPEAPEELYETCSANCNTKSAVGNNENVDDQCGYELSNTSDIVPQSTNKVGGMLALENALQYADSVLKASGEEKMTAGFTDVMNAIWEHFDHKGDYKSNVKSFATTQSAVDQVKATINQIWDSFDVKGPQNISTGEQSEYGKNESAASNYHELGKSTEKNLEALEASASEGRDKNYASDASEHETSVVTSAMDEIDKGLKQIWEGFASEGAKGIESLDEKIPDDRKDVMNAKDTAVETSPISNLENCAQRSKANNAVEEVNHTMNCIWESFAPTHEKDSDCRELDHTESDGGNEAPKQSLGLTNSDNGNMNCGPTKTNFKASNALEEVTKALDEIWEYFTPRKPLVAKENKEEKQSFSDLEKKDAAKMLEACESMKKMENCPVRNGDSDKISSSKHQEVKHRNGAAHQDVDNAMKQIWESFRPKDLENIFSRDQDAEMELDSGNETIGSSMCNSSFHKKSAIEASTSHQLPSTKLDLAPASKQNVLGNSAIATQQAHGTPLPLFSEGMIDALSQGFEQSVSCDVAENTNLEGKEHEMVTMSQPQSSFETASTSLLTNAKQDLKPQTNFAKPVTLESCGLSTGIQDSKIQSGESVSAEATIDSSNFQQTSQTAGAAALCPLIKQGGSQNETSAVSENVIKPLNIPKNTTAVHWFSPPKQIFKPTVTALEEYGMLRDGDKVLVCLSGGKDSLSLLHTIRQYQFYAKGKGISFDFGAVTVDPMTPAYDPSPLKEYLAHLGVPYFYESQCILETAEQLPYECASICSFCSRMKRGRIYAAARREGYNVLALGQHLDDLAESFLMSFFHNGNLNTMKAHYTVKQGDLRVIRPFVYVREAYLRAFAEQHKLPVIAENCPACFEAPKERHRTKQLLAAQEVMFPQVYSSMMAALKPLMGRGRGEKLAPLDIEEEGND